MQYIVHLSTAKVKSSKSYKFMGHTRPTFRHDNAEKLSSEKFYKDLKLVF